MYSMPLCRIACQKDDWVWDGKTVICCRAIHIQSTRRSLANFTGQEGKEVSLDTSTYLIFLWWDLRHINNISCILWHLSLVYCCFPRLSCPRVDYCSAAIAWIQLAHHFCNRRRPRCIDLCQTWLLLLLHRLQDFSATVGCDAELSVHKTAYGCTYYVVKNTAFSSQTEAIRVRRWCAEDVYKVGSRMHAWLFCYDVFFARSWIASLCHGCSRLGEIFTLCACFSLLLFYCP
jgi:hypothetical protein